MPIERLLIDLYRYFDQIDGTVFKPEEPQADINVFLRNFQKKVEFETVQRIMHDIRLIIAPYCRGTDSADSTNDYT